MPRKDDAESLGNARIHRRMLLDEVIKKIEADEPAKTSAPFSSWHHVGSIERQCALLKHLLKELIPNDHNV